MRKCYEEYIISIEKSITEGLKDEGGMLGSCEGFAGIYICQADLEMEERYD